MSEQLVKLDLASTPRTSRKAREVEKQEYVAESRRVGERLFKKVRILILYSLLSYEEMNLVLRMETYFERNGHIGVHWLKQLQRLVRRKQPALLERQMKDRLLD